jgi:hypothetical protein
MEGHDLAALGLKATEEVDFPIEQDTGPLYSIRIRKTASEV